MSRILAFNSLKNCPVRSKWMNKITQEDKEFCIAFLKENENCSYSDFEYKANRLFLDNPNKPKKWGYIWSLLIEANSKDRLK